MDKALIPTQQAALAHASPDAKADHQETMRRNREQVEKGRTVPEYHPVLTLEQRVAHLESRLDAVNLQIAKLQNVSPAASQPE